jgi:hypothetical protein
MKLETDYTAMLNFDARFMQYLKPYSHILKLEERMHSILDEQTCMKPTEQDEAIMRSAISNLEKEIFASKKEIESADLEMTIDLLYFANHDKDIDQICSIFYNKCE